MQLGVFSHTYSQMFSINKVFDLHISTSASPAMYNKTWCTSLQHTHTNTHTYFLHPIVTKATWTKFPVSRRPPKEVTYWEVGVTWWMVTSCLPWYPGSSCLALWPQFLGAVTLNSSEKQQNMERVPCFHLTDKEMSKNLSVEQLKTKSSVKRCERTGIMSQVCRDHLVLLDTTGSHLRWAWNQDILYTVCVQYSCF